SQKSTLVAFDADQNVSGLTAGRNFKIEKYGKDKASPWRLGSVAVRPPWSVFEVLKKGKTFGTYKTRLMGEHNLFNVLSAVAIADNMMIPDRVIAKALETFQSVKRRQEVRGRKNNITVIDDFAHHPTAVRETIRAVKPFYPDGRLIAVFEPRTNSSMRNVFQDVYPLSFDDADVVCIRKPPLLEKIPLAERFSSEQLVRDLKKRGKDAQYFSDTQSIINFLIKEAGPGDVVLIMSNGGFDNIHERLLELL
ncbi:MAG: UDP-N-acetylmuramate:L-alanyl-gamma-D-glutamyl-meso-diaminopimelate ligase, partial [Deltaproteobacteria bacterium]|nr:UDP-N-acetylmuramate:L-alanyl-gamma-D-glutamyl-meso-diaminopimelate ligase [Deltaproteobacteria bacterium]